MKTTALAYKTSNLRQGVQHPNIWKQICSSQGLSEIFLHFSYCPHPSSAPPSHEPAQYTHIIYRTSQGLASEPESGQSSWHSALSHITLPTLERQGVPCEKLGCTQDWQVWKVFHFSYFAERLAALVECQLIP